MGRLFLRAECGESGITRVTHCEFTAPFKVAKTWARRGYLEIMPMTASPGMLAGDRHEMVFEIERGARVLISGQSYLKLYDTGESDSEMSLTLSLGENAACRYLPLPAIPFAGSSHRCLNRISLSGTSKLMFCDFLSCGRSGMGERFAFRQYLGEIRVEAGGKPAFLDKTRLVPAEGLLSGTGYFEGHSHQGVIYLYGYEPGPPPEQEGLEAALTRARRGHVIYMLANSGQAMTEAVSRMVQRI